MDVRDILKEWLIAHGYQGLRSDDDCACGIDDLMCCDSCPDNCESCYKVKADCGHCDADCESRDYKPEFCYTLEKPEGECK